MDENIETTIADAMVEGDDDDIACTFNEGEAPTVKKNFNLHPELDIDDDEDDKNTDYVDVPDEEPVIRDGDNPGNGNNKWGNEPQVGVQQRYVWRIQRRLQYELGKKIKGLEKKWLFELLKKKKWRIPAEDAPEVTKELELDEAHESYYPTVHVWLPDKRWGRECMPCCSNCKTNRHVVVHGFRDNHAGRLMLGLYRKLARRLHSSIFRTLMLSSH